MSINWSEQLTLEQVIIPILVALVTTLVVEYFAKPKLEARKARLIRDREQLDRVVHNFQRTSMAIAAIPSEAQIDRDKIFRKHFEIMLNEARDALYSLTRDLAKLSTRYVANHSRHVSQASYFIGYLLSQVELLSESRRYVNILDLKNVASKLELFDVYFLVYIYMIDSQEEWWRRWFWRMHTRKKNAEEIEELFRELKLGDVDDR